MILRYDPCKIGIGIDKSAAVVYFYPLPAHLVVLLEDVTLRTVTFIALSLCMDVKKSTAFHNY